VGRSTAAGQRSADRRGCRIEAKRPQGPGSTAEGDLAAEPFTQETLRLVEDLIAFLRSDKVEVRLYDKGFLHARRTCSIRTRSAGEPPRPLRPFVAIVGSSNFTGPGLSATGTEPRPPGPHRG